MRFVFLDSGPLGLLTNPRGRPKADQCRQWVKDLAAAGVRIFVPEVADYEVRRKLIHVVTDSKEIQCGSSALARFSISHRAITLIHHRRLAPLPRHIDQPLIPNHPPTIAIEP
jgi:hypothetical protein